MIITGHQGEEQGALRIAELICVAIRTAPKGRGVDNIETMILTGADEFAKLGTEMRKVAESDERAGFFGRDAGSIEKAKAIVLIGTGIKPLGLPACGYCGFTNCSEMAEKGGVCAFSVGDLGIAMGSAVSMAADLRVDNRIMFSIGRAALNLGYFSDEIKIAYGIPINVSGKNPFFDRVK